MKLYTSTNGFVSKSLYLYPFASILEVHLFKPDNLPLSRLRVHGQIGVENLAFKLQGT